MRRQKKIILAVVIAWVGQSLASSDVTVCVVSVPDARLGNAHYVGNREPLAGSPLIKLPIGSIKPMGWLRRQLELEAVGFTGHLTEISNYLEKETSAWLSQDGEGKHPWEETPYWLKGFGDLGYVLGDERIIAEAKIWIEGVIGSQRADGYFGPRANLTCLNGKADLWSNMVMLNALQTYYEYSGDGRVLALMTKYFRWELGRPEDDFLLPFWQQQRAGDNLASVYWLYNRTGEGWLLELADRIHKKTADWSGGVADWHNVNIAQGFREPAVYWQQAKDAYFLQATERNYAMVWGLYGQAPGGLFGGDEMCRAGFYDARQAIETCGIVEFMLSCEMLARITGEVKWLDRCVDAAYNSLPASMTADLKGLHYLTSPNLVQCDRGNKFPDLNNGGDMLSFNPRNYRCCQHNVSHGWPYFAEHLWLAAPGNGLAAAIYSASEVRAKVGDGKTVVIREVTRYPFEEGVEFEMSAAEGAVRFPLYLAVPGWCEGAAVKVNGEKVSVEARPGAYIVIDREWRDGDRVSLRLPMSVKLRHWVRNHDSVSVDRGPLTYSLKIGERYEPYGEQKDWRGCEVFATTAWNYGLVIDDGRPIEDQFKATEREWPRDDQPFTTDSAPIVITATGRKIANWQLDYLGMAGALQGGPAKSGEPDEKIEMIPMGCARLRMSALPRVSGGAEAVEWVRPGEPVGRYEVEVSKIGRGDPKWSLVWLCDGVAGQKSNDNGVGRFSWYPTRKTPQWVQYNFKEPRKIHRSAVYWYDNQDNHRIPAGWRIQYNDGAEWKDVPGASGYPVRPDEFNTVTFEEVTTKSVRLIVEFQPTYTVGILEWTVE